MPRVHGFQIGQLLNAPMEWARFALLAAFSLGACLPLAPRGGEDEEASAEEALAPKFELPEAKFTAVPGWAETRWRPPPAVFRSGRRVLQPGAGY